MLGKTDLPFTLEEYFDWKQRLEAGYAQPRPGVSADEIAREIATIPEGISRTYIVEKYIGREKRD